MKLRNDQIKALLVAARETREREIDCDEFLGVMAELAEARAAGQSSGGALASAEAHERLCANCREECAALLDVLTTEPR